MKLNLYLELYPKVNSMWMINFEIKTEYIKHIEKNGQNFIGYETKGFPIIWLQWQKQQKFFLK